MVDDACELDQESIPRGLDDAFPMLSDLEIKKIAPMSPERLLNLVRRDALSHKHPALRRSSLPDRTCCPNPQAGMSVSASRSTTRRTVGHVVAGMMLTFSAMLLYIPTFAAVIWPLARVQDVEAEPNEALSRTERDDRA